MVWKSIQCIEDLVRIEFMESFEEPKEMMNERKRPNRNNDQAKIQSCELVTILPTPIVIFLDTFYNNKKERKKYMIVTHKDLDSVNYQINILW